mmetsp:Transcript_18455/g.69831  ORF Transcript_18455/g.69831 Transcript_18455/m.69831 type:complete len:210 (+) Transcript_18455:857-1486(+)
MPFCVRSISTCPKTDDSVMHMPRMSSSDLSAATKDTRLRTASEVKLGTRLACAAPFPSERYVSKTLFHGSSQRRTAPPMAMRKTSPSSASCISMGFVSLLAAGSTMASTAANSGPESSTNFSLSYSSSQKHGSTAPGERQISSAPDVLTDTKRGTDDASGPTALSRVEVKSRMAPFASPLMSSESSFRLGTKRGPCSLGSPDRKKSRVS